MTSRSRADRRLSAARRQAARYRRVLEELVQLATDHLLEHRDDPIAYQVVELVGPVLAGKSPHGGGED